MRVIVYRASRGNDSDIFPKKSLQLGLEQEGEEEKKKKNKKEKKRK